MTAPLHQPRWLRDMCPPQVTSHPDKQSDWLKAVLRPYAGDLAAMDALEVTEPRAAEAEILLAALGFARRLQWHRDIAVFAARQEWGQAKYRVANLLNHLGRSISRLADRQATDAEIHAASNHVNDSHGSLLPPTLLEQATRRVVLATVGRRQRARTRR